jgi:metal-dependent hydrolase (beta-lactamase superfamily II)
VARLADLAGGKAMKIKISTLSENTADPGYLGEWGLSMFIEADGLNVLLIMGYQSRDA